MKDRKTYKILTACSFVLPINRWYLGNAKGAFGRSISCNYLLFGWLADLMYMDKTFDEAMAKRGFLNTNIRNSQNKQLANSLVFQKIHVKLPRTEIEGGVWCGLIL